MNSKLLVKFGSIFLVLTLILMNLYGANFGDTPDSARAGGRGQPYNSFKQYIWGGLGEQQDAQFGWNITYIQNLNGDSYPDLVISAPLYDSTSSNDLGMVYIFYGKANTGFNNINFSQADVTIRGEGLGNKFGWDVADAGDINNDGTNDLIVGAPGALNGNGRAYIFFGGSIPNGLVIAGVGADRIINGPTTSGQFGTSVTGIGDINNDGWGEVLVGAPAADQAIISYGYNKIITLYPDIWDDNLSSPNVVNFNDGCNNGPSDTNTWGLDAGDDGWDWINNVNDPAGLYGGDNSEDGGHNYGPPEPGGADAEGMTWSNRAALEVCVGRGHTSDNPYGSWGWNNPGGSAAWGIQFTFTPEMFNIIGGNGTVSVSFDYGIMDTELIFGSAGTEEAGTIRSRIWNGTNPGDRYYLGDIIGNGRYIYYHTQSSGPAWGPNYGSFEWDITDYIGNSGNYYWDIGCWLGNGRFGDDEGVMAFFDNVSMKVRNIKNSIIQGVSGSRFGASVEGIDDIDGDGIPDFLVGAPRLDGGYVALINGKKRFKNIESVNIASIILTGKTPGDQFGFAVSSAGDVDNDNLQDIIIGAPGGSYANLYFGSTLKTPALLPDLWENLEEINTPYVEFDTGLRTTGNTPDISGDDDGWDTWGGAYGAGSGSAGSSTKFNGADGIDTGQIATNDELIIGIGGYFGNAVEPDSGAYGLEFQVTSDMIQAIDAGADAVVSYNWRYQNRYLGNGEEVWIRTHIRNGSEDLDLGFELDGDSRESEVYWSDNPPDTDVNDVFIQDFSEFLQRTGSVYFDIGGKVDSWDENYKGGIFHFDNFYLRINQPPDVRFIGEPGTNFGASVGYCDKLNFDDYGDIIIGAPHYDSPNGVDSGAIFGFFDKLKTGRVHYAKNAEYATYGERAGDNFGWSLSEAVSVDSDEFAEVATSAINYDDTVTNAGRIYILSITRVPRIRMVYPLGGEVLNETVAINATVIDPDNNIDNNFGVRFFYSTDLDTWTTIGEDKSPTGIDNIYEQSWNTISLPDGSNYYLKAWVRDLDLNSGENITSAVTVDNTHPPQMIIQSPTLGETIEGIVEIQTVVRDSNLDLIGGGINTTRGINFYFSKDKTTWELLGSVQTGTQDEYSEFLETLKYPDGEYWIKVNATDWDGFEVEEIINVTIDNPGRAPSITLLDPVGKDELKGLLVVRATAFDFDGDINSSGVTFYIMDDASDNKVWQAIGNVPTAEINSTGGHIYTTFWDTTTVSDGWYMLKAYVMDNDSLSNESEVSEFKVHNEEVNPPFIKLITPLGGEMVKETQMITARVRDLEGNIDSHGVDYYYSDDRDQWRWIGSTATGRVADEEFFDFLWQTDTVPDGEYWLNVSVSDDTPLKSWDVSDEPIFIHNSRMNPPFIRVIAPTRGQHINGTFTVQASAIDLENNINTVGVIFMFSSDGEDWNVLTNVPSPSDADVHLYEYSWNTAQHPDGKYWLKAEATDFDNLKGSGVSDYFFIQNNFNNPPEVTLLHPNSGEVLGTIKVNATAFDLENNINNNGVKFYYSTDNASWQPISSDASGNLLDEGELFYEISWDTSLVPDNIYWLRAEAEDLTNLFGSDISDDSIIVHNKRTNPPKIIFKQPQKGLPMDPIQSIIVEVIDFDDDVESVTFLYSSDNKTWELIDSRLNPEKDNTYKTIWETEKIFNGDYYIKIVAKDKMGNQEELTEGPFEVTVGKDERSSTSDSDFGSAFIWIIIIIVIVVIMVLVILLMVKRGKRREKELIAEVSAELRGTQPLEGEIVSTQGIGATDQTYVPASQAGAIPTAGFGEAEGDIEHYKDQMDAWRDEGFLVTRLENLYFTDRNMFMNEFPVFKMNVSKLRDISGKLDTIDTTGQELEVDSIRAKLYDPDQALAAENEFNALQARLGIAATDVTGMLPESGTTPGAPAPGITPELAPVDEIIPQLMPGEPAPQVEVQMPVVEGEVQVPPETEIPPDVELPPDIGLPPEEPVAPPPEGTPNGEVKKPEEEEK